LPLEALAQPSAVSVRLDAYPAEPETYIEIALVLTGGLSRRYTQDIQEEEMPCEYQ